MATQRLVEWDMEIEDRYTLRFSLIFLIQPLKERKGLPALFVTTSISLKTWLIPKSYNPMPSALRQASFEAKRPAKRVWGSLKDKQ